MKLEDLERQHRNARTVRDVVTSMRALAAVQVRQGIETLRELREYERGLRRALSSLPAEQLAQPKPRRVMLVVLGTDQGLCGHFTRRLVDEAVAELERLGRRAGPVVCAGYRTRDRLLARGIWSSRVQRAPVSLREVDVAAQELMTLVNESVEEERCDGVRLVYTRHEGSGQGTPRVRKVYPITRADLLGKKLPSYGVAPRLHTSLPEITDHILFEWVYAAVYRSIVESVTAEHDARLRTTDRATRTVDDRLEALRLDINRERQHAITEEILDIMSGSQGVSGNTLRDE
jgi:F-type H+-transporting ATPase subunit gamma